MELHTFIVPDGIAPCRLEALTLRMLPLVPPYAIREAFANKDVKVDGVRAKKGDTAIPLSTVQVYIKPKKAYRPITLIYEDEHIAVVRKPAGISCEEDFKGGATVPELCKELMGLDRAPILCHRLDNPTQGLLLLAKNEHDAEILQQAFSKRDVHKQYICLVKGCPKPDSAVLHAYLRKDAQKARVTVRENPFPGAVDILTGYETLQRGDPSRLQIDLLTGRTHQIRAHMSYIGHPILGDDAYGDREWNKSMKASSLKLCACELWFTLDGELQYLNDKHFTTEPDF